MKALVGVFNQEKAVGAFSVIVKPMDRFTFYSTNSEATLETMDHFLAVTEVIRLRPSRES